MKIDIFSGFRVLRDDLYPFLGGGNKGRKITYIKDDIIKNDCNAIVTTGGIQSNHCRAVAVLAAEMNWSCTLIIHGSKDDFINENGNSLIMRLSGANVVFTQPSEISSAMDSAMDEYIAEGLRPYYLYGGGHTLEGGLAYIDAVEKMYNLCANIGWYPDYIFLASGSGSTQAGIMAGLDKLELKTKVVGVSVGRAKAYAEQVTTDFYFKLCEHYNIPCFNRSALVLDDYLCGGYGKFNDDIKELSLKSLVNYGFTLDTTYTAKAFYGMQSYISDMGVSGNILFWHTGGFLNFLAEN